MIQEETELDKIIDYRDIPDNPALEHVFVLPLRFARNHPECKWFIYCIQDSTVWLTFYDCVRHMTYSSYIPNTFVLKEDISKRVKIIPNPAYDVTAISVSSIGLRKITRDMFIIQDTYNKELQRLIDIIGYTNISLYYDKSIQILFR